MERSAFFRLPGELMIAILGELELLDFIRMSHSCRILRQRLQPDRIISLVESLSEDAQSMETLPLISLSHAMAEIFKTRVPYRFHTILSRGASFKHINHARLLSETYTTFGPGRRVQFMLRNGASLHRRPDGINGLLCETILRHGPGRFRDFLFNNGASLSALSPGTIDALIHRGEWSLVLDLLKRAHAGDVPLGLEQHRLQVPAGLDLVQATKSLRRRYRDNQLTYPIILKEVKEREIEHLYKLKRREIEYLATIYRSEGLSSSVRAFLRRTSNDVDGLFLATLLRRHGFGVDVRPLLALGASLHRVPPPSEPWHIQYYHRGIYAVFEGAHPDSLAARVPPGCTPLRMAAGDGLLEITRYLLEKGADMEIVDDHGYTPGTISVLRGHIEVMKLLIEWGADMTRRNNAGESALETAIFRRYHTAVQILEELHMINRSRE